MVLGQEALEALLGHGVGLLALLERHGLEVQLAAEPGVDGGENALAGLVTVEQEGQAVVASPDVTRDQIRNREDCVDKLAAIVKAALARPKKRKPTKPSRGAKERRIASKKRRSDVKKGRGKSRDD